MPFRLRVDGLGASRGEDPIFRDISLILDAGGALLVTGRNGTGKSTFLRTLAGLHPADSGTIVIEDGGDATAPPRESLHYLGHRNAMKRDLTVEENLLFWSRLTKTAGDTVGRIDATDGTVEALESVGLGGLGHLPFGYLSAGQQRRAALARLLVAHRPVWLMDEPTAALDTASERMVEALIAGHRSIGGIVIAATHQALDLPGAQTLTMAGFAVTA
ncbi:cytochrome C biogenesis protein [Rhizobium sp. Leaf384]|uniref:heme ABC exporter ATP-binding protein CcmA n=1 Tax=unclassified Rhizobium TaxID=2613769 RepID=UPI0007139A54|nr:MULTISPECIES: heme ABC exporter ATP-binding protein CcmA [unclassified Rhizobium]KQS76219.1 cytochrome C biogenesis protein [Rhizobium sp. Leaf384]KQS78512.1 cytochrome C biogenesis protein [Rhizobium sp. Leaf383]